MNITRQCSFFWLLMQLQIVLIFSNNINKLLRSTTLVVIEIKKEIISNKQIVLAQFMNHMNRIEMLIQS